MLQSTKLDSRTVLIKAETENDLSDFALFFFSKFQHVTSGLQNIRLFESYLFAC
jgi:hypothetical protein